VLLLPPGSYDVYWMHDNRGARRPFLLVPDVAVAAGGLAEVRADSGISARVPEGSPIVEHAVVPAGESFERLLHWGPVGKPLLLPPGTYDVVRERSGVWKAGIEVTKGALVDVTLPKLSDLAPAGGGGAGTGR
jgi:hypothetical protein